MTARQLKEALDFLPEEVLDYPLFADKGTSGMSYDVGYVALKSVTALNQGGPAASMEIGELYISLYVGK